MPYCEIAAVEAYGTNAGVAYNATNPPTITAVNTMIDRIARDIDGRLAARGITTPIVQATSPKAYAIVADINAVGAAWLAQRASFARSEPNRSVAADALHDDYEDAMKRIVGGELSNGEKVLPNLALLQDAAGIGTPGAPWSRTNDLWDPDDQDDIDSRVRLDTEY